MCWCTKDTFLPAHTLRYKLNSTYYASLRKRWERDWWICSMGSPVWLGKIVPRSQTGTAKRDYSKQQGQRYGQDEYSGGNQAQTLYNMIDISMAPHSMRLRPAPHCRTPIVSYSLNIEPKKHFLNWLQDPFSNYVGRVVFPEPTSTLRVSVDLVADLTPTIPLIFVEEYAEHYPFTYPDNLHAQLAPFW